jgi:hypothetical protein
MKPSSSLSESALSPGRCAKSCCSVPKSRDFAKGLMIALVSAVLAALFLSGCKAVHYSPDGAVDVEFKGLTNSAAQNQKQKQ